MVRTLLFALLAAGSLSTASAQSTWFVDVSATAPGDGTAQSPYTDLQFALGQSSTVTGDTLLVASGTYSGSFDFLGKDVVVRSTGGPAQTILDGGGQQVSVVNFVSGEGPAARLEGFTVTGGNGSVSSWAPIAGSFEGGGVRCMQSSPTLVDLVVTGNRATRGGGILLLDSSTRISDSTITANSTAICCSTFGVGIFSSDLAAVIERCTIDQNHGTVSTKGGGLCGRATVMDTVFLSNSGASGSGVFSLGCTFDRCTFEGQTQHAGSAELFGLGGAISHLAAGAGIYFNTAGFDVSPTIARDCLFVNNESCYGGAVASGDRDFLRVERSEFIGNDARFVGQAESSSAGVGGAAYRATLVDCVFRENVAELGGAIFESTAIRCHMVGNRTRVLTGGGAGQGGGAHSSNLVDCELSGNTVVPLASPTGTIGHGGGSYGGTARRTVYVGNTAHVGGGAATGRLEHCTLYGNTASMAGDSLAVTTFSMAPLIARNVIVWGGGPDHVFEGTTTTITYSDVQGGFPGTGNFDLDPQFFGPESGDFQLKPGSPCIDAGDPASALDPDGSRADVGAFPARAGYCAEPAAWCTSKRNSMGCFPLISSSGTPSVTGADDFFIEGSDFLGDSLGLLIWGRAAGGIDFQGGTLCVGGPLRRAGLGISSGTAGMCDGAYSFHFSNAYAGSQGLAVFDTLYAQWIARDFASADGTGWSLSNALEFTLCP